MVDSFDIAQPDPLENDVALEIKPAEPGCMVQKMAPLQCESDITDRMEVTAMDLRNSETSLFGDVMGALSTLTDDVLKAANNLNVPQAPDQQQPLLDQHATIVAPSTPIGGIS